MHGSSAEHRRGLASASVSGSGGGGDSALDPCALLVSRANADCGRAKRFSECLVSSAPAAASAHAWERGRTHDLYLYLT